MMTIAFYNLPLRHEGTKSNNDEITNSIKTAFAFLGVLVSSWLLSFGSGRRPGCVPHRLRSEPALNEVEGTASVADLFF